MKYSIIFLFFIPQLCFSQGKYSYEFSSLLEKKFVTEKDLPLLKGFRYEQGIILGEISENAPYYLAFEVFRKANVRVVIFEKMVNPETKTKSLIEVLKFSNVLKNQEVRVSGCSRKNPYPDEKIVAVVTNNTPKLKILQAFVLKDNRFEKLDIKKIKCINEIDY